MNSAEFIQLLRARLASAMGTFGDQEVSEIQASIGTPYPPASAPGAPPHRRKGYLQDGVGSSVATFNESQVRCTVVSERVQEDPRVPAYLEFGTAKMLPRPYMTPQIERSSHNALERIGQAVLSSPISQAPELES